MQTTDTTPEPELTKQEILDGPNAPVVVFDGVRLAFDEKVILTDVSFTLLKGHTKIFLGASGAGKSTILKLILGLLPGMRQRGFGHIINVSSIGAQTNTPRFSAYVASKSALDAFARCIGSEIVEDGVDTTTIYFPTISPEEAAEMITNAFITRQKKVATRLGTFGEVLYALAPKAVDVILNTGFKLFPESSAAKGSKEKEEAPSTEGVAFAYLMRGVHW